MAAQGRAPGARLEKQEAEKMACSHRYRPLPEAWCQPPPAESSCLIPAQSHRKAPFREDLGGSLR